METLVLGIFGVSLLGVVGYVIYSVASRPTYKLKEDKGN